jgi:hypothetical protein
MADYGTPMGTEVPGQTSAQRRKVSQPSEKELKARIKDYEARSQGESRRSNVSGRGTSQGDSGSSTKRGTIFDVIRDKKFRDSETIDKAG